MPMPVDDDAAAAILRRRERGAPRVCVYASRRCRHIVAAAPMRASPFIYALCFIRDAMRRCAAYMRRFALRGILLRGCAYDIRLRRLIDV